MLINISNHPSENWSKEQVLNAKEDFGEIFDLPFPNVLPEAKLEYVLNVAKQIAVDIANKYLVGETVIHVMGEMTLTFHLVSLLKARGFRCVASTTERDVTILEDGTKNVKFNFVQFRDY